MGKKKIRTTSQKVNILDEEGKPLIKGAIIRSFNQITQEYYLTFRTEEETTEYYIKEERLQ